MIFFFHSCPFFYLVYHLCNPFCGWHLWPCLLWIWIPFFLLLHANPFLHHSGLPDAAPFLCRMPPSSFMAYLSIACLTRVAHYPPYFSCTSPYSEEVCRGGGCRMMCNCMQARIEWYAMEKGASDSGEAATKEEGGVCMQRWGGMRWRKKRWYVVGHSFISKLYL